MSLSVVDRLRGGDASKESVPMVEISHGPIRLDIGQSKSVVVRTFVVPGYRSTCPAIAELAKPNCVQCAGFCRTRSVQVQLHDTAEKPD